MHPTGSSHGWRRCTPLDPANLGRIKSHLAQNCCWIQWGASTVFWTRKLAGSSGVHRYTAAHRKIATPTGWLALATDFCINAPHFSQRKGWVWREWACISPSLVEVGRIADLSLLLSIIEQNLALTRLASHMFDKYSSYKAGQKSEPLIAS